MNRIYDVLRTAKAREIYIEKLIGSIFKHTRAYTDLKKVMLSLNKLKLAQSSIS
jgi:hypothetical protein